MKRASVVAAVAMALGFAGSVSATVWNINVSLDGSQETPPVATTGTGTATVGFNDVTGFMDVLGSFSNLTSPANNAHVHGYAAVGGLAPPVINLSFTAATSGTFSGSGTIPAGDIQKVMDGLTYINLHSVNFGGGEIRGQIIVPEPAALGLLAPLALLAARRRRM